MSSSQSLVKKRKPQYLDKALKILQEENAKSHPFLTNKKLNEAFLGVKELLKTSNVKAWVVEINQEISGFTVVQSSPDCLKLVAMYITSEKQRQGLGKELMRKVKQISEGTIELAVYEENNKAIHFYQKCGFSVADSREEEGNKYLVMRWIKS